jgi:hypothetical protein
MTDFVDRGVYWQISDRTPFFGRFAPAAQNPRILALKLFRKRWRTLVPPTIQDPDL